MNAALNRFLVALALLAVSTTYSLANTSLYRLASPQATVEGIDSDGNIFPISSGRFVTTIFADPNVLGTGSINDPGGLMFPDFAQSIEIVADVDGNPYIAEFEPTFSDLRIFKTVDQGTGKEVASVLYAVSVDPADFTQPLVLANTNFGFFTTEAFLTTTNEDAIDKLADLALREIYLEELGVVVGNLDPSRDDVSIFYGAAFEKIPEVFPFGAIPQSLAPKSFGVENAQTFQFVQISGEATEFSVQTVPVPATLTLYGLGVGILGLLGWRKRHLVS